MAFLNPLWLWGPLAALGVAVPVAIHLLNRYRQRRINWAAMELLRRATTVRARRIRLEDLLLLLLRCLALLLLALALARPTLLTGSSLPGLDGAGRTAALIAVDASYSMEHRGVHSRFDRGADLARQVADTLQPGDPVTLVLMGRRPRVLMRNLAYDPEHFARTLDAASPYPEPLHAEANLEILAELAGELKGASREAYLITDAQAVTWGELDGAAGAALRRLDSQANTLFLPVGGPGDNIAITGFDLASGSLRPGGTARYLATLYNAGPTPVRGVTVTLLADDRAVDARSVDVLGPGETRDVPLFYRPPLTATADAEPVSLTARLPDDAVASDNERFTVADVRGRLRVLIVDGSPGVPGGDPFEGEAGYLTAALAPASRAAAGGDAAQPVTIDTVPPAALSPDALTGYDTVVLAGVPTLSPPQLAALKTYVEGGGGLMIFLGDRIDARIYNQQMLDEAGLSPVRLKTVRVPVPPEEQSGGNTRAAQVVPVDHPHPLARLASSLPRELLDRADVMTYLDSDPVEGATTVLRVGGGAPLVTEHDVGHGRVILFTTSADLAWSRLPLHPLYPILVNAGVTRLARHVSPATEVGEPITVALPGEAALGTVTGVTPGGDPAPLVVRHDARGATVRHESTDRPGFYKVHPARGPPLISAVNVAPR